MGKLLSCRKNVLGAICFAMTAAILLAGLWPFNFWPENKVRWLKDQNGIQFYGQGIVYTEKSMELWNNGMLEHSNVPFLQSSIEQSFHHSNIPLYPITIELWLQPGSEPHGNLPHIFSIYDRSGPEGFFIGQWRSHLIVGKGIHGKDGYREMGIRDILKKGERRFVAITSGADGTRIYVGGILSKANPRFYLFSTNEKPSGQMVLGNSPTGNEYWTGDLLGLAIYDRVLTEQEVSQHYHGWKNSGEEGLVAFYPLDEGFGQWGYDRASRHNLFIPPRFQVLQKTVLTPPWVDFQLNRSYLMDILTNILGFIPFGFFSSAFFWIKRPRSVYQLLLISILFAACISLSIELIQVYLPTRSSQLIDVITNILGAVFGTILFFRIRNSFIR